MLLIRRRRYALRSLKIVVLADGSTGVQNVAIVRGTELCHSTGNIRKHFHRRWKTWTTAGRFPMATTAAVMAMSVVEGAMAYGTAAVSQVSLVGL